MPNKYNDREIIGWFYRNGKRIPLTKKVGEKLEEEKPQDKTVSADATADDKIKTKKAYKDTIKALAHKGFDDKEKHEIASTIAKMPTKAERDLWIDAFKRTYYMFDVSPNGACFYRPSQDMVHLKAGHNNKLRTIFHETAHRLDYNTTIETEYNGQTKDVEPSVLLDLMVDHDEVYDNLSDTRGYDTDADGNILGNARNKAIFARWADSIKAKYGEDMYGAFTDVSSGLTHNKLGEFQTYRGHDVKRYWAIRPWLSSERDLEFYAWNAGFPTYLSREFFVHFMSLKAVDRKAFREFKKAYPILCDAMEEIYAQLI